MNPKIGFLALAAVVLLSGCPPAYNEEFLSLAKKRGYSLDQQHSALGESYTYFLEEDGQGGFTVKYRILSNALIREELDRVLADIDSILSYKNQEWARHVDYFASRGFLEQEEKRLKVIRSRVRAAELHDLFKDMTGVRSLNNGDHANGFNHKAFVPKDLSELFDFTLDRVKQAKEKGILQLVEKGGFFVHRKYDRKEQDPSHLDDPNRFVWVEKAVALEVNFYKIVDVDPPGNNQPDYAECFRVVDLASLKLESQPCVKAFRVSDGVALVVDVDKEGEAGYGSPDHVVKVSGVQETQDIFSDSQMLEVIFKTDKSVNERVPPKEKTLFVEIARVGSPVNVWQDAPDANGWLVPFSYKDELESNFNVKFEFDQPKANGKISLSKTLKSVKKEWTNGVRAKPSVGAVVEHYRLKPPFNGEVLSAQVLYFENSRKVSFVFKDGSEETGVIVPGPNKFIEDAPFAVEYTEGEQRWRMEKHGDSQVFNKRKQISPAVEPTGLYR